MRSNGQAANETTLEALMKFKRLTTEVGEGSSQMFGDEMFVEVFGLNIMVVFVVMEMVLVLQYYGVPLHLLFMTFKCN